MSQIYNPLMKMRMIKVEIVKEVKVCDVLTLTVQYHKLILTETQLMWLTESEPESFLQHELDFSGNVATKHPGDLREPDNKLR